MKAEIQILMMEVLTIVVNPATMASLKTMVASVVVEKVTTVMETVIGFHQGELVDGNWIIYKNC